MKKPHGNTGKTNKNAQIGPEARSVRLSIRITPAMSAALDHASVGLGVSRSELAFRQLGLVSAP